MPLADQIEQCANRANEDLDRLYGFYDHTKQVWRVFQITVDEGRKFVFSNLATSAQIDETQLLDLSQEYATEYLASFTFQRMIAIFETFTFSYLRSILLAYPRSLSAKQVLFGEILGMPDLPTVIERVIDHELNQLKYEKPTDWFDYIESKFHVGGVDKVTIKRIAEMKASRDILEHGNGIVNPIYLQKAGDAARWRAGERIVVTDEYHRESWYVLKKAVNDMRGAGLAKFKS